MKNKIIIVLLLIIVIIGGILVYEQIKKNDNSKAKENENIIANTINTTNTATNTTDTATNTTYIATNTIQNPTTNNNLETSTTITTDEAAKILEEKYGVKDEQTGNTMSYGYMATVQDKEGNRYYAFRHSWLVDNSHMSFLQNIFISVDGKTIKTSETPAGYEENEVVEF